MNALFAYGGLFFIAFLAATLLPAQSEAALAGLIAMGNYSVLLLLVFATAGNVLGSTVNWLLGKEAARFAERKWFPINPNKLEKARGWYAKYGRWSLLLSWTPVIGDPLTFAAGLMKERLSFFIPVVTIAKLGRYILVWLAVKGVVSY